MKKLSELKREAAALQDRIDAIQKAVDEANDGKGREYTDAEQLEIDENLNRLSAILDQVETHNRISKVRDAVVGADQTADDQPERLHVHGDKLEKAKTDADEPRHRRTRDLKPNVVDKKLDEIYPTHGRFLMDVVRAGYTPAPHVTERLRELRAASQRMERLSGTAPTTFANESVGTDGAFAVPPSFSPDITKVVDGEDSLLGLCDVRPTEGNEGNILVDETTSHSTTSGVQVYWVAELGAITQSKPNIRNVKVPLHKLGALVPLSDEIMEDAPGLEAHVNAFLPDKINYVVNRAILAGTGAGQPLGLLGAPALKSVAAEGSQTADTINYKNTAKMYAAMLQKWRKNAVWVGNTNIEPQLLLLTDENGNYIYNNGSMYPGMASLAPPEGLMGRRVILTEAAETLGDLGDLYFANLKQYAAFVKSTGLTRAISMDLWFDFHATALRYTFRVGGAPLLSNVITGRDGTSTYSPFVALAVRAG